MRTINLIHQKIILSMLFIAMTVFSFGQESTSLNKLEYNYFSITPIEVFFTKHSGGLAISSNLGFSINDHLLSLSGSTGEEIAIFGRGSSFYQLNLLYGREIELSKVIYVDVHLGGGLYGFNDHRDTKLTRFGLPLIAKLRFKTGERFSLGIKFQANINSIQNNMAVGIVMQWNSNQNH